MSEELREQVERTIHDYEDPVLGAVFAPRRVLRELNVDGGRVSASLAPGFPTAGYGRELAAGLTRALEALPGVDTADVRLDGSIQPHAVSQSAERLKPVKNIIAVASAKGGVGKSTVAANLALALAAEGARVGMLDADIYGPSQPRMLGVDGKPESLDGKSLEPLEGHGLQSMSVGYLVDQDQPMVWRGPMVTKALQQLLYDTNWRDLDYLIVDMPPGTGDIQLTLSQKVPVAGAVIVTTPQEIATLDARKGLEMFRKVDIPVLGIIENMSLHVCSNCGHEEAIFGAGGGQTVADAYGVPLLGSLPLTGDIREHADSGRPSVVADPEGDSARRYHEIALRTAATLAGQRKDYARKFPKIVVEEG